MKGLVPVGGGFPSIKALGISVNRASGVRDEGMRPEEWPPAGYYALLCAYTVETT
jgi:hypothetical protein